MTARQKLFAEEYLIDFNATRAYKAAYTTVKKDTVAATNGGRLLKQEEISAYIDERMKARERRTEISQDRVLTELAKIGFADLTDFIVMEENSIKVKPFAEIPPDKLGAIAGMKKGTGGFEIKLNDKEKALELMGRHLGMWKDKMELSGTIRTSNPYSGLTTEELRKLINGE